MSESDLETQFKQEFMARVREARVSRGLKQWEMAEALEAGMPQDKYKQYESRSLLPHYLVGRFCLICRVDPVWLMTGTGKKPMKALQLAETEPGPKRPVKAKKARNRRAA